MSINQNKHSKSCEVGHRYDGKGYCTYSQKKEEKGIYAMLCYNGCSKMASFPDKNKLNEYIDNYLDHGECPVLPGETPL